MNQFIIIFEDKQFWIIYYPQDVLNNIKNVTPYIFQIVLFNMFLFKKSNNNRKCPHPLTVSIQALTFPSPNSTAPKNNISTIFTAGIQPTSILRSIHISGQEYNQQTIQNFPTRYT